MKKSFKKTLAVLLSILMIFSMSAIGISSVSAAVAGGTTVYLVPNSNWKQASAWFAIYVWNSSGNNWAKMADSDGDGYYEATLPSGSWNNIIFCRMSSSATSTGWSNVWNQTSDLTLSADKNCYTVASGAWSKGSGSWSWYELPTEPESSSSEVPEVTEAPTDEVTEAPTDEVTEAPTDEATETPTDEATEAPTDEATEAPTDEATEAPTDEATEATDASEEATDAPAQEAETILYLLPNSNWNTDGARFAAYFFGAGETWVDMTDEDGDGTYQVTVPEGGYTTVIFCRMNPSTTENNWDNKWNQTGDLVMDDTWNTSAITGWDAASTQSWVDYESGETPTEPESVFLGYSVAGEEGLVGVAWDPAQNYMTDEDEDGIWTITFYNIAAGEYKFKVTDGSWNNSWGAGDDADGNTIINLVVSADVTITFDATTKEITTDIAYLEEVPTEDPNATEAPTEEPTPVEYCLFGYINGANYGCEDDYENVGEYVFVDGTLVATFAEDSYVAVKTTDNANWYMFPSYVTDKTGTLEASSDTVNEKMFIPGGVEVTFTLVVNEDGTLTLTADYVLPETEPSSSEESEATEDPSADPDVTEDPEATEDTEATEDPGTTDAPVEETVLYLLPNDNWNQSSARFAAYFYDADGNYTWVDMTDENADGTYEVVVPEGAYTTAIFCRMNPSTTENNWDNKWNQTDNCVMDDTWNTAVITGWDKEYTLTLVDYENGETPTEPETEFLGYSVAGEEGLVGVAWDPEQNFMTDEDGDGVYTITFYNIAAGDYQFKVTNGTWNSCWGGDGPDGNYVISLPVLSNVTITFDSTAETIGVEPEYLEELPSEDTEPSVPDETEPTTPAEDAVLYLVPNANWNEAGARFAVYAFNDAGNAWFDMVDTDGDGIYEVTIPGEYQTIIFCRMNPEATENNWDNKWNQTGNLTITSEYNQYTMTEGSWDTGAWGVFGVEPVVDYYLFGYINGANYGCEDDSANMGEYKFVDGTLTVTFESDSYIAVKTTNNATWYMFSSYVTGNTGTLANTSTGNSEKMFVPGGVEVTFTLVDNGDDTLTLSYDVTSTLVGDVDGDGEVTINDATKIQKYLAKLTTLGEQQIANADVNNDGKISVRDATYIQMYVAQLITAFPIA